ncbi:MAG: biotin--[acetyl-CoA-carboxylase] ligase [Sphingomonadaceae bacterium]
MIHTVPSTGSTNADLAARLVAGEYLREGDWLVADRQEAGKGRQGRDWIDGAGNFMGSTVVHRREGDPPAVSLALLAGLALHEALVPLAGGHAPMLKWPNDLLLDGAKLAGILLEGQGERVIVGIGVNLVSSPSLPDRKTVSLASLGIDLDRDTFAEKLAAQFDLELERWRSSGLAPVIRRWTAAAHPAGTALTVHEPSGVTIEGSFAGLDETGALKLHLADGSLRVIHAGDVDLATATN